MAAKDGTMAIRFMTPFHAIEILDVEYGINDKIVWRYSGEKTKHKSIIYYTTKSDRAYFKVNGRREYLDEYMRTDRY